MPIEHTALSPLCRAAVDFGLTGEYFASADFTGAPVLTRIDRNMNFNWDKVVPVKGPSAQQLLRPLDRRLHAARAGRLPASASASTTATPARTPRASGSISMANSSSQSESKASGERGEVFDARSTSTIQIPTPSASNTCTSTGTAGIDLTWSLPPQVLRDEALKGRKQSDIVIACVGLSPKLEGEEMPVHLEGFSGGDRTTSPARGSGRSVEGPCRDWQAAHRGPAEWLARSRSTGRRSMPPPSSKPGIPAKKAEPRSPRPSPATTIPPAACPSPSTLRSRNSRPSTTTR